MEIISDYQNLIDYSIDLLNKKQVNYGEVRYTKDMILKIIARDMKVSEFNRSSDHGIGIRVQVEKGAPLAFVSTSDLSKESIKMLIEEAVQNSLSLSRISKEEINFSQQSINKKNITHLSNNSIFDATITEIKDYVITHSKLIKDQGVSSASCGLAGLIRFKHIMTTEGNDISYMVDGVGYRGDATIRKMGKFESFAERKGGTIGFKALLNDLEKSEIAEEIGKTVITMITGKSIDSGSYDVIIDPAFSGLLAHESFGHMTEADSIVTRESALSDRIGERFAPEFVSIADDSTLDKGAWNFIDDEGIQGQKSIILDHGILEKFLSDRLNAYQLDTTSTGNSRAQDYGYSPIVRMTNTCFLPGDFTFDEMLEDIKLGIFCKGHAGGEAGNTGKFSFRSQVSYLIENGEITNVLSGVTLNGNILEYLGKIDAVGKKFELTVDCGFGGCGKGGQTALVGLGGSYLRFRNVNITGSLKRSMPKGMMMK
ncbi:MAG: TldD/PmbA family protein [Candidatus Hodarchaeota archaeon]